MEQFHYSEIISEAAPIPAEKTMIRQLIADKMSINFIIKMIEIAPSGYTDRHSHPYEHGIYVLEGSGEIVEPGGTRPLSTGHVVFIRPEEEHQVINNSRKILRLLNVEPVKVKIRDS